MKRILMAAALCFIFAIAGFAQQSSADTPATKEDIERYLTAMRSREMMAQMVEVMSKPMHQMIHESYLRNKNKLHADFEERSNARMDEMMKSFPWDELLDSMVPVYQKHFTKGDVDALVVFYGSPTGQKVLREMPAIMGEAMQAMMPLMRKQMDAMEGRLRQEIAQLEKEATIPPSKNSEATPR